ncbi:DUF2975 domain-containing protein [Blastococcus sp. TF02-9]|uniref:DUF2975 domain-containing protein n=1 Tax=Blastococcus sp. TF02-09 TaxID=2250576 RepID=UPI001314BA08|nr:DUF2975 domain-containing protein [Blastococcus sp. TF02-9]
MQPQLRFPGRTGTSLVSAVLLVAAVVALLLAVALPFEQLGESSGSVPVTLAEPAGSGSPDVAGLPEDVVVADVSNEFRLTALELPAGLRVLTGLPDVLTLLSVAVGAWLLGRVLSAIHDGRPFDRRNPGRLAGLAAAVLVGGLVVPVVEAVGTSAVLDHLDLVGPDGPFLAFEATLSFVPVGVALALVGAAEAFRRGRALEDELEGTV